MNHLEMQTDPAIDADALANAAGAIDQAVSFMEAVLGSDKFEVAPEAYREELIEQHAGVKAVAALLREIESALNYAIRNGSLGVKVTFVVDRKNVVSFPAKTPVVAVESDDTKRLHELMNMLKNLEKSLDKLPRE